MTKRESVGVALCTYNGQSYLSQQIESIQHQTLPVSRIIVSDDKSEDQTPHILGEIAHRDKRVRVVTSPQRLGVAKNFEYVCQYINDDFIAFCDQDDVWYPNKIARILEIFSSDTDIDLVFTNASLIQEDGEKLSGDLFSYLGLSKKERARINSSSAYRVLFRRNVATGATMVVRRALLERAFPCPPGWLHDEWLALWVACHGKITCLNEPLIKYRQHQKNVVGVTRPTLSHKIRRVLYAEQDRNTVLAQKFLQCAKYLERSECDESLRQWAWKKARFECERALFSRYRMFRIHRIIRLAARSEYADFASQGHLDIVRDLLQKR